MKMSIKQTVDFIPNDEGSIVKLRYSQIEYETFAGKMMSKIMKPKLQKMRGHALETASANLVKVSTNLLENNPDLGISNDIASKSIDIKEAVDLKLAG